MPSTSYIVADNDDIVCMVNYWCCSCALAPQEVDGASLMLLTTDVLVNMMKIKIGPAVKIMRHIDALRR